MDRSIPAPAALLLTFIYRTETGRSGEPAYRTIYGHNEDKLAVPLTAMTVDDVLAAQPGWTRRFGSSAAGAPQFMRDTLKGLKAQAKLTGREKLAGDMQDRLALMLLMRRGYADFVAGRKTRIAFGLALAQEWASFPVLADCQGAHRGLKRGQSYYSGDRLNHALTSPAAVEAVLEKVLAAARGEAVDAQERPEAPKPVPTPPAAPAAPAEPNAPATKKEAAKELSISKRFWTWLTAGGGTTLLPFVDWRVQILIVVVIVAFAIYAIATMPAARRLFGLPVKEA